jgi:Ca2+-binding RTX toxin-like protein
MATFTGTSNSETIYGTTLADIINGLAGHDNLFGLAGNDVIDGGAGNDFLNGGLGNDILIGGSGYNDLNGAGGADIFRMSSRIGAAFSDDLIYDMTDDDLVDVSAWGISDFSQIQAIMGLNYFGATLDAYYNGVHHVLSFLGVVPCQFEASDFVYSTALGGTQNGTALQDTLFGSTGNDTLNGLGSRDRLLGGLGDDTLNGGDGNDDLIGGAGRDVMTGGAGYDWYIFDSASETGLGALRDVINGFVRGQDKIELCDIDANAGLAGNQSFVWRGTGAFTGAGQLRYVQSGGNTIIQGSTDADSAAEFEIQLTGLYTLSASDFFL